MTFHHVLPRTVSEAVDALAPSGSRVVSGGTWLVPELVRGAVRADTVVDLARLELPPVRAEGELLVVSATATYADLLGSDDVASAAPVLRSVCAGITGGAQLVNVGTLVGSACRASPASDAPTVLAAVGATMRIAGPDGIRESGAAEFFGDGAPPDLRPDELVFEIALPVAASGDRHGYVKLKHSTGSWPIVTACFVARARATEATLAVGGLLSAPAVTRCRTDDCDAVAALPEAVTKVPGTPWADVLADGSYRRSVAPVAARRAIKQAYSEGATCS